MAKRFVYVPNLTGARLVAPFEIDFQWVAGLSLSQKQKNIRSLHQTAHANRSIDNILEISTKSENALGVALSAFNLTVTLPGGITCSVETAFQSSKVFEAGGPYVDLRQISSAIAKSDPRLKDSGRLIGFCLDGTDWPLTPTTAVYDWLYLSALKQHPDLTTQLVNFSGFTDIEFNPQRSLNCQAAAAALFVSLTKRQEFDKAVNSPEEFLRRIRMQ